MNPAFKIVKRQTSAKMCKKRKRQIIQQFFDLYALLALDYYCGLDGQIINHFPKAKAISTSTSNITLAMYTKVQAALEYSVRKEITHIGSATDWDSQVNKLAATIARKRYNRYSLMVGLCKFGNEAFIASLTFIELEQLYSSKGWQSGFGGVAWGKAAKMLQTLPSLKEMPMWIDKVFDMQHNNGFILNKTEFVCLHTGRVGTKRTGKKSPLNLRAMGKLADLSEHASPRVKGLCIANYLKVPQSII